MTGPRRVPVLIATVGLPGSGKTTWARAQQETRLVAVSERDNFRTDRIDNYAWKEVEG